ncbi:hypothetical protein NDU88_001520 [Pleurodeles waltl]|uniref:Uncharacterized protein n=1 Tax=Pleurodeles waltl TaxID=8319 RepID=A0AAV7NBE1_PLEWA|nr:hypothetical protein NDU88_001520 [Pleurodeles waltl]
MRLSGCGRWEILGVTSWKKAKHHIHPGNEIRMVHRLDDVIFRTFLGARIRSRKAHRAGLGVSVLVFGLTTDSVGTASGSMVPKSVRSTGTRMMLRRLEHTWC